MGYGFKILVEGEYALFTRPEFKVERVSYDVPTVSAMEGLIKSIYWKPAIRIVIDKIVVFHPIRFINIRRNEVSQKVPLATVKKQMNGTGTVEVLTSQIRSQRASMLLRDVKYGVEFHFEMTGLQSQHPDESPESTIILCCGGSGMVSISVSPVLDAENLPSGGWSWWMHLICPRWIHPSKEMWILGLCCMVCGSGTEACP